jgi:TolA-binding protein
MNRATRKALCLALLMLCLVADCSRLVNAQNATSQRVNVDGTAQNTSDLLRTLDRLVQQNEQLEKQNRELMDQVQSLRHVLGARNGDLRETSQSQQTTPPVNNQARQTQPSANSTQIPSDYEEGEPEVPLAVAEKKAGTYTPGLGFKLVETSHGDASLSIFSYFRYLNQLLLAPTYTNAFGNTIRVQQRQDFQLAKVQIKFLGWFLNPKFRYFMYTWTSNANMGQGAQVVVAGNLNYEFSKAFVLSGGINALPGTRSLEGNFPYWLSEDSRLIADEYFKPSYTSGIWARGEPKKGLKYWAMVGNNLSQLGVNAAQLPQHLSTFSTALVWMPSSGEFGPGFGDYEYHEKLATRFGAHYTESRTDKQSQPDTEAFQNTQIRLSDGSIVFTPGLFGPGIRVNEVTYRMAAFDSGIKYHGYSLWGEYYLRWLQNWKGINTGALPNLFDQGFQIQASTMVVPKTVQLYAGGSEIFGQFGTPWDSRFGMNYFPFKNRLVRLNTETIYLFRSPVGYLSLPYPVGAKGWVFHTNFELAF